jgi:large subunit ribosomal protein L29
MKVSEIRDLGPEEMQKKADDLREELFNLRFQQGTGQLENTTKLKQAIRDIARLKTIIREVSLKQDTQKE